MQSVHFHISIMKSFPSTESHSNLAHEANPHSDMGVRDQTRLMDTADPAIETPTGDHVASSLFE